MLITQYQPSVIAIQETHLKPTNTPSLPGYKVFSKIASDQSAHEGVLLAVKSNIQCIELQLSTNHQIIAVSLHLDHSIIIGSIYLPSNTPFQAEDLSSFLQLNTMPKILAGDYNAHNPMWDSGKFNANRKQLEKLLLSTDLTLLNSHQKTHFNFTHKVWSTLD